MRVFLDTVGCRLNQAEIEIMARQFRAAGHEIVERAALAELAVVNTCAVTRQASSDSRGTIRRIASAGDLQLVATGCWATVRASEAAALPGVSRVVSNGKKDRLVADLLHVPLDALDLQSAARLTLPGGRRRTRAFIKVQDGCDNRCTFCVTTLARGRSRSRTLLDVIRDAQAALEGGTKEIVLTGVHLASWGRDLGLDLKHLVRGLLAETAVPRLRLSSLEPWDLDEAFFSLWEDPRLCRHLHLPLQSGSTDTLRRMARRTSPRSFETLVSEARRAIVGVSITTDVIAGFPGESEREFEESLEFVRKMHFAGGHAFSYSPQHGTAAARFGNQIGHEIRRRRNTLYRALFAEAASEYRKQFLGRCASVLWVSEVKAKDDAWRLEGLTDNYLRVRAVANRRRWNEVDMVRLRPGSGEVLSGVIVDSGQLSLMGESEYLYNLRAGIHRPTKEQNMLAQPEKTFAAQLIDGKAIAQQVRDDVASLVAKRLAAGKSKPTLAAVLVGDRVDSQTYVKSKGKACEELGMGSVSHHLPAETSQDDLERLIRQLNDDKTINGILVQLPLPSHLNEERVLQLISIEKDVDGFSPINIGRLAQKGREPLFVPCTPYGCIYLLEKSGVKIDGANAVVLGRSNIVGMPAALLLIGKNATVTVCHSRTKDIAAVVRQADILIAAIGKTEFVRGDWIKPGAAVIDVGINSKPDPSKKSGYRLVGDVNFDEAKEVAGFITPVPGGVGPMTIAMLMKNTFRAAEIQAP